MIVVIDACHVDGGGFQSGGPLVDWRHALCADHLDVGWIFCEYSRFEVESNGGIEF